jgi:hypothetical protein
MHMDGTAPIEWRVISGCPNYEVSADGRVRRIVPAELKPHLNDAGYWVISLPTGPGGKFRQVRVHRLVASAFLGPHPVSKPEVNHKDRNRRNNRIENLEWVSRLENAEHAVRMGGYSNRPNRRWSGVLPPQAHGESHASSKLTDAQVLEIRSLRGQLTNKLIAKRFGVSPALISLIQHRRIWQHLEGGLDIEPALAESERVSGWAKHLGGCTVCGTTEVPHAAKGLCEKHYFAQRYRKRKAAKATLQQRLPSLS